MVKKRTEKDEEKQDDRESIEIVLRKDWNAREPKSATKMEIPVREVYYTETDTKSCKTKKECVEIVKGLQKFHMDLKGMPDIHYNFLIGGDGNIYEGRGWFNAGPRYPRNYKIPQHMTGKCIEIAFIGAYKDKEPSKAMKEAAYSLVMYGLEHRLLLADESQERAEVMNNEEENKAEENDDEVL